VALPWLILTEAETCLQTTSCEFSPSLRGHCSLEERAGKPDLGKKSPIVGGRNRLGLRGGGNFEGVSNSSEQTARKTAGGETPGKTKGLPS